MSASSLRAGSPSCISHTSKVESSALYPARMLNDAVFSTLWSRFTAGLTSQSSYGPPLAVALYALATM